MPDKLIKTPYDDLTFQIIGCAMAVHRKLGPGLKEETYQRDLGLKFDDDKMEHEPQKNIEIYDTTHGKALIGYYIPDFIVAKLVVVEIKALKGLDNSHLAQVIGYLAVTGCPIGLLINFGERSLKVRRVLPPKNIREHQVNQQWLFAPDWLKKDE